MKNEVADGKAEILPFVLALEDQQKKGWAKVKDLRSAMIISDLEHAGNLYQVDEYSRENMVDAVSEMTSEDRIDWRTSDNQTVNLSAVQIGNILTKYRQRKLLLSKASWAVEADILASEDPSALNIEALYNQKIAELTT